MTHVEMILDGVRRLERELADTKEELKAMEESRENQVKRASGLVNDLCSVTEDYIKAKARAETAEWTRLAISLVLILVSALAIVK